MMKNFTKAPATGAQRLDVLQVMRAVAALMIVALHAQANWSFTPLPIQMLRFGAGVDLFFVISGFVIVYASQPYFAASGGCRAFLLRRFIRIVPLYWFVLTLKLIALAGTAFVGMKAFPALQAIVTSYLFIPYDSMGFGDAYPFPLIDLGWTLNYEMFFYLVFAVFIFLPLERAVFTTAGVLLVAVLIGSSVDLALPFSFWFQPIILEFVAGMLIATLFLRGARLPPLLGIATALCGLAIWMLTDLNSIGFQCNPGCYSFSRLLVFGGGAILLMAAATLTRNISLPRFAQPLAKLGDSSYALYLLHPFIFRGFKTVLGGVTFPPEWSNLVYLVIVISTVAIAHAFHVFVETPANLWLRDRLITSPRKVVVS
ncbi:acyltransferase [Agrobacterium fabrum]|jgi:exopolysaccharide production protein ExoZ|uniref:Peptidoglycan/LPS O-acetylase OafA/YrhL, contains acyltransferase and SGNH-hydrolase domains n=3 Tax=Agrobacterium fabrum TaxID=1176649 RepID=A0A7Z7BNK1_9HYPH|nr:acyltransferase [Agrobacterium fabrum]CUX47053.1 Exopolysaccharide biosynthesis protein [Agrobacterium fabrum str. J-07]MCR6725899.1 acyltransferase [Agrobacterium fabrum]UXT59378.1 acyltransferase [Agrobacterium fabrum]WCK79022.1 acyltransferase [Agrobacterium fabrum]SDJ80927.1 Peptidoglycan/LPS O-acetylase OafA/YrhL, contains acyltransferase and SGNH-hydrolase domains [Agrobacterium fabrum]